MRTLQNKSIDMTEGEIWSQLLRFAIPLVLGDLFQQLYNTVDSVIVGNFIGKAALAAVGATNSVINVLIGLFTGISTGATVVIAHHFGAHEDKELHDAVHTTIALILLLGVGFTVFGVAVTPWLLRLLGTPADVYASAETYLRIYFFGASGLVLYNMCAGIFRAVGDSRRPLLFLIVSSGLNIVLDLLFIVVFHMGVGGAALATVISQFVSACILLILLARSNEAYGFRPKDTRLSLPVMRRILNIGLPVGVQKSLVAFSNTIVISYINRFGSGAMAGWSVYHRLDQIIYRVFQSMSIATTTFVSQNIGAGKKARITKGVRTAFVMTVLMTGTLAGGIMLFATPLIRLFNADPEILHYGRIIIFTIAPFLVVNSIMQVQAGELRGFGDSKGPMCIMIFCLIVLRQIYLWIGWPHFQSLQFVAFGYPMAWTACALLLLLYRKLRSSALFANR